MKMSLWGYNRKETDDYFSYLNESSRAQADQIASLQTKLDDAEKTVEEYRKLDALNRSELDALQKKAEDARRENETLAAQVAELQEKLDAATRQLDEKKSAFEADKLGFIFAVAYKDIENKNKAVGDRIRDYADMMFDRMAEYRNQVTSIVSAVTDMQNRQREELQRLCDEATERLNLLTDASSETLEDMQKIEESRNRIYGEIDQMLRDTINTSGVPLAVEDKTKKADA